MNVQFSNETYAKLAEKSASKGQLPEQYVAHVVENDLNSE